MEDSNKEFRAGNNLIAKKILETIDLGFEFDYIPFMKLLEEISSIDVLSHTLEVIKSLNIIISGDLNEIRTLGDANLSAESLQFMKEIGQSGSRGRVSSLLKLSALYHDIGKFVRKPRHGQQGYYVLEMDVKELYLHDLDKLKSCMKEFIPEEEIEQSLSFVGQVIRYHDLIGTLSTGESSYLRLCFVDASSLEYYGISDSEESQNISPYDFYDFLLILTLADMAGTFSLWDDLIKLMMKDREVYFKVLDSGNSKKELIRISASMEHAVERIRRLSDLQIPPDLIRNVLFEKLQEKDIEPDHFFSSFSRICWLDYGWRMFNYLNQHAQRDGITVDGVTVANHVEAVLELLFAVLEKYVSFTSRNRIGLELSFISENPFFEKSMVPQIFEGDEKTLRRISEEVLMWNMGEMDYIGKWKIG